MVATKSKLNAIRGNALPRTIRNREDIRRRCIEGDLLSCRILGVTESFNEANQEYASVLICGKVLSTIVLRIVLVVPKRNRPALRPLLDIGIGHPSLSITSEHTNHSPRARADERGEVEWRKIILNKRGAVILEL